MKLVFIHDSTLVTIIRNAGFSCVPVTEIICEQERYSTDLPIKSGAVYTLPGGVQVMLDYATSGTLTEIKL